MGETWVQSWGWEDPLEKGKATLWYSGLENFMDCVVHGVARSQTQLNDFFTSLSLQSPVRPGRGNSSSPETTAGKMCLMENRTIPFWF